VVFNLSSWASDRRPFADWLVAELVRHFGVGRAVGQHWIVRGSVMPMLDGLDEVDVRDREACLKSINAFRASNTFLPMVACSRIREYEALNAKLNLRSWS
jgi:predicted NACHT family NTPase